MATEYFTDEEIKEYNITDYKYKEIQEKFMVNTNEKISIWDYKENHKRFKAYLDAKKEGATIIFNPYLPLFITDILTKDNLFKKK